MSGLDSLMDGWSMTGSLGKKGSSMNAMKTSGGGQGSSPRGGSTLVPPTSGPTGPSGDDDDIFGLRGGSAAGSPRVAGGGAGGSDLDDIFGLGQMSTATCVLPSPRALASIAPGGPADPDPPNHTTPTHLALGADSTLPTLLAQPRRLARPGASSAIPIATPGAPPASDFFSSPAVAHLSSSPAGGSRATPSGSASNPFGALGDVDDLLGGLGAPSTTGPGSSAARRGAPMVSSPSANSNDFLSGGGGGPGPVSGDDPLLGAVFGDGGDSGPSSSVVAAGGSSAHLSSAGELSPAGGSSNDLLGDLFGGASAGGSGQSSPSPATPRDASRDSPDPAPATGATPLVRSNLAPTEPAASSSSLDGFAGLEDLVSPAPPRAAPTTSRAAPVDSLEDLLVASTNGGGGGTGGGVGGKGMSLGADLDAVFGDMSVSSGGATNAAAPMVIDDMFGPAAGAAAGVGVGVAGELASRVTAADVVYDPESDGEDQEGDTEARKKARAARHERNRARIASKLQEKRDREAAAAAEQAERQVLKDLIGADIDEWLRANQGNIRTMLANLGDVLWEGHGYKAPGLNDLVAPASVKKSYHKALVIIHPDKVRQRGGETDKVFIADKVFDQVRDAFKAFSAKEL